MNATDSADGNAEESGAHAYFRAVEEAFIRLRGAPFLLSPEDWRVATSWWEAGVPIGLVERVLEKILSRREEAEPGKAQRIRSLRYFDSAVQAAWKGLRSVAGSEDAREASALDVERSLAVLAASLPERLPGRERLARRIRGLEGDSETIEETLAALDREMMEAARDSLGEDHRLELERRVEASLERLGRRLPAEELDAARRRLTGQVLRRLLDLPLLSLFSPQAQASPDS